MKFKHYIILSSCLLFLPGCSTFNNNNQRGDNNLAYSISPEVASKHSTIRQKPTQPEPEDDEFLSFLDKEPEITPSLPEPDYTIYTVKKGDTLYGIARRYEVSPAALMKWNGLDKNSILMVGQTIKIENDGHTIVHEPENKAPVSSTTYVVKPGDSLYKISRAYHLSVAELKSANQLTSDKVIIGQKLTIPPSSGKPQAAASSPSSQEGTYVIQRGDTLSGIARKLGVKQSQLQDFNGIEDPNRLRVGQTLKIPGKNSTMPVHKPVTLPAPEPKPDQPVKPVVTANPQPAAPKPAPQNDNLYTIQEGDTISVVAKKLNIKEKDLMEINYLDSHSTLQPGKKLLIPQQKSGPAAATDDFFDNFEDIPVVEVTE